MKQPYHPPRLETLAPPRRPYRRTLDAGGVALTLLSGVFFAASAVIEHAAAVGVALGTMGVPPGPVRAVLAGASLVALLGAALTRGLGGVRGGAPGNREAQ